MTKKNMLYRFMGLFLIGISFQAQAQTTSPAGKMMFPSNMRWSAFGVRAQAQDFYVSEARLEDTCNCNPQTWQNRGNVGLAISYYRNTGTRLSYSLDLGISNGRVGTKPVPTLLALKERFTTLRGDIYYHMGPAHQPVSPYLHTGVHAQIGSLYASIPTGLGIRYTAPKRPIMLTGEINYGWGITNELRNSLIVGVGMYVRLKNLKPARNEKTAWGGKVAEEKKDSSCFDSDFDGVPDGADKCPKLAGSPLNNGCPNFDTDKDGVNDETDECPTVAGPVESKGCPVRTIRDTVRIPAVTPPIIPMEMPAIHFRTGTTTLDSNALQLASHMATIIKNSPGDRFVITGYSKLSKPDQKVSYDQVLSVINYLVEKEGIRSDRLIPKPGQQGEEPNRVKVRVAKSSE